LPWGVHSLRSVLKGMDYTEKMPKFLEIINWTPTYYWLALYVFESYPLIQGARSPYNIYRRDLDRQQFDGPEMLAKW
jgi:hypothetical protein